MLGFLQLDISNSPSLYLMYIPVNKPVYKRRNDCVTRYMSMFWSSPDVYYSLYIYKLDYQYEFLL